MSFRIRLKMVLLWIKNQIIFNYYRPLSGFLDYGKFVFDVAPSKKQYSVGIRSKYPWSCYTKIWQKLSKNYRFASKYTKAVQLIISSWIISNVFDVCTNVHLSLTHVNFSIENSGHLKYVHFHLKTFLLVF